MIGLQQNFEGVNWRTSRRQTLRNIPDVVFFTRSRRYLSNCCNPCAASDVKHQLVALMVTNGVSMSVENGGASFFVTVLKGRTGERRMTCFRWSGCSRPCSSDRAVRNVSFESVLSACKKMLYWGRFSWVLVQTCFVEKNMSLSVLSLETSIFDESCSHVCVVPPFMWSVGPIVTSEHPQVGRVGTFARACECCQGSTRLTEQLLRFFKLTCCARHLFSHDETDCQSVAPYVTPSRTSSLFSIHPPVHVTKTSCLRKPWLENVRRGAETCGDCPVQWVNQVRPSCRGSNACDTDRWSSCVFVILRIAWSSTALNVAYDAQRARIRFLRVSLRGPSHFRVWLFVLDGPSWLPLSAGRDKHVTYGPLG